MGTITAYPDLCPAKAYQIKLKSGRKKKAEAQVTIRVSESFEMDPDTKAKTFRFRLKNVYDLPNKRINIRIRGMKTSGAPKSYNFRRKFLNLFQVFMIMNPTFSDLFYQKLTCEHDLRIRP